MKTMIFVPLFISFCEIHKSSAGPKAFVTPEVVCIFASLAAQEFRIDQHKRQTYIFLKNSICWAVHEDTESLGSFIENHL